MNMVEVMSNKTCSMGVDRLLRSDFDDVLNRSLLIDLEFVHNDQSLDDIELH
jgi:hypothetical protein